MGSERLEKVPALSRAVFHQRCFANDGDSSRPRHASLRDAAPATSSVRNCWFPRSEIESIRSFPPLECARGVNPIQIAKSRPVRKPAGSGTTSRTVAAKIGLTPGIAVTRCRLFSLFQGFTPAVRGGPFHLISFGPIGPNRGTRPKSHSQVCGAVPSTEEWRRCCRSWPRGGSGHRVLCSL